MKKKLMAILLSSVLVLALAACGGAGGGGASDVDESVLGMYNLVSCKMGEWEIGADGEYLNLKANGDAEFYISDDPNEVTYTIDGGNITITEDEDTITGTIDGNVIVLNIDAGGVSTVWTFAKEGSEEETTLAAEAEQAQADLDEQLENMSDDELEALLDELTGVMDSLEDAEG